MSFAITARKTIFSNQVGYPFVVFAEKLSESLPPIPEEGFTHLGTAYYLPRKDRQPGQQFIVTPGLEFLRQRRSPRERSCFVAVCQEISDSFFTQHPTGHILVQVQIVVEIPHPGILVKLVDFQSGRFG